MQASDVFTVSEILENEELFSFLAAQHYDVALAEAWQICGFGMFHALGIPTRLGSFAVPLATQLAGLLGIPSPPSFVPCKFDCDEFCVMIQRFFDRTRDSWLLIAIKKSPKVNTHE